MTRRPILPTLSLTTLGLLALASCGADRASDPRPNILLVTFDTTRADHLSCYGYRKKTSPAIDALAQDGVRYDRAYAVASWTLPTHSSLFTGKFPSSHGSQYDPEGAFNLVMEGGIKGIEGWSQYRANPIADDEVTLAALLTANGYATGGIVGGPWMKSVFRLSKGFELYDDRDFVQDTKMGAVTELNGRTAESITNAAKDFVNDHADEAFFLFLNYYDPHTPYTFQGDYIREFWDGPIPPEGPSLEWNLALYDAEIRYTDHHFGRLIQHLKDTGLYDTTWIILTADHGELMGENNLHGHGDSLSEPEIHVPLIVKGPGATRARGPNATPVQQVDIMPTILDAVGIARPPHMQGGTLDAPGHPIVSETNPLPFMDRNKTSFRQIGKWKSLYDGKYKFVHGSKGRHLLFDIERDPYEQRNLIDSEPERAGRMQTALEAYFATLPKPGAVGEVEELSEDTKRLLEGFGYGGGDE